MNIKEIEMKIDHMISIIVESKKSDRKVGNSRCKRAKVKMDFFSQIVENQKQMLAGRESWNNEIYKLEGRNRKNVLELQNEKISGETQKHVQLQKFQEEESSKKLKNTDSFDFAETLIWKDRKKNTMAGKVKG